MSNNEQALKYPVSGMENGRISGKTAVRSIPITNEGLLPQVHEKKHLWLKHLLYGWGEIKNVNIIQEDDLGYRGSFWQFLMTCVPL